MDAITYLTGLALLLIIGIIGTIVARKLRISSILLFVLTGIALTNSGLISLEVFRFPSEFLVGVALLTLAMIVFDGSSRFSLQDLDKRGDRSFELVMIYTVTNILILGTATLFLVLEPTAQGLLMAMIFAVIMAATDPGSVFILLGETKHKVLDLLRIEAIINTPITVIIPFIILDILRGVTRLSVTATFTEFVVPFLQQVIVGVGTGILFGVIVFRIMRRHYSKQLSPILTIATTVLAYVVAEQLAGNGVVAVATLGLVFGNSYVKRKGQLMEFSSLLASTLRILVFLFVGMLVVIDFSLAFFLKSLLLFVIAIVARFIAIVFATRKSEFNMRERVFMSLNMPKGIAVAVVTLAFSVLDVDFNGILTLIILFVVYSLIVSSVIDRFGKFFIRKEIVAEAGEQKPAPAATPAKPAPKPTVSQKK